jgi:uncharacterized cupredoxin-like copper-binding protein
VVILGLGLALVLVLLGAGAPASAAPRPVITQAGTSGSPRPVNVILREYRFDPTPLYLVPGETVRLTVLNGGMVEHELALGDADFQAAWAQADAEATPLGPLATAPPASVAPGVSGLRFVLGSGGQAVVDYAVPDAGTLQLICHLPGHAERGMVGEVVAVQP